MKINQIDTAAIHALTGANIKAIRQSKRMSQEQFADGIGITRAHLFNIERGQQGLTTFLMTALCIFLRCSPVKFFPTVEEIENSRTKVITRRAAKRRAENV